MRSALSWLLAYVIPIAALRYIDGNVNDISVTLDELEDVASSIMESDLVIQVFQEHVRTTLHVTAHVHPIYRVIARPVTQLTELTAGYELCTGAYTRGKLGRFQGRAPTRARTAHSAVRREKASSGWTVKGLARRIVALRSVVTVKPVEAFSFRT